MKLIALFTQPPDPAAFDRAYYETHLPLIAKVPGLRGTQVHRITRNLSGTNYYVMTEMLFDDEAGLKAAMRSPEMAAAGANLQTFAADLVTMLYAKEE